VLIEGGSMAPALAPGDWALTIPLRRPKVGDVVVVEHPGRSGYEMVKRLLAGPGDRGGDRTLGPDEWWIEGDFAAASTDSRQFGPVRRDRLKSKVVLIYWPKERRGRL
jgi:nickel-type superoxide dismutase maturation protease